jgi:hemolysin activation/secretion protein
MRQPCRPRAGSLVLERLRPLVDRRRLRWNDLERQVLLAGELPGLTLGSAFLPGDQAGGARLALDGDLRPVAGKVQADNLLRSELGRNQLSASMYFNMPFHLGEQWIVNVGRSISSGASTQVVLILV